VGNGGGGDWGVTSVDVAELDFNPEPGAPDFIEIMKKAHTRSLELITDLNEPARLENINSLFNLQYKIASQSFRFARFTGETDQAQPVVLATFHKCLITLYAAHVLMAGG